MEKTEKLLQTTYQSAKMGTSSINTVLSKTEDKEMRKLLMNEMDQYDLVSEKAAKELFDRGEEPKEKNFLEEKMADMMIQMKTITDKQDVKESRIAEMMISGANMGIIEVTKAQNAAPNCPPAANQVASDFLTLSQRIVDEMKPFL